MWESKNRQLKVIPTIKSYKIFRPFTSAMFIIFDFYEMASDNILPTALKRNHLLQLMLLSASNYVSYINDIYSLRKEMKHDASHNLVSVIKNEKNVSWEEALDNTAAIIQEELNSFCEYEKILFEQSWIFDKRYKNSLKRYLVGVKTFMRANIDFSIRDSFRYNETLKINVNVD
ncbi:hypothetical protein B4U80_12366 [Leptotrombidium deliense]|uniref:Terpene synthase n=1 Tax=Leptotrombidium deliense TaxID=299467 RepID=A0A443RUX5_9ACAR|nr:hypothetical protein B4U80_12366 [Leptotrombidium deliense]